MSSIQPDTGLWRGFPGLSKASAEPSLQPKSAGQGVKISFVSGVTCTLETQVTLSAHGQFSTGSCGATSFPEVLMFIAALTSHPGLS